jgi:hypothetical protein
MTEPASDSTTPSPTVNPAAAPNPIKYFYRKNTKSDDVLELQGKPWDATIPPRPGLSPTATKKQYRDWCNDENTDWCFFTFSEGLTPSLRVTADNPMKYRHGVIIDYDAVVVSIPDSMAAVRLNAPQGLCPTAISRTFSGATRLVWEFEEPVLCDDKELGKLFMEEIFEKLHGGHLLAGPDKKSFEEIQYFEIGNDWVVFPEATPLPTNTLHLWLAKAAMKVKKPRVELMDIPMERIAAEVERQFPGRWKGDFKEGVSGPVFWVDDGIDRIGCQILTHCVHCFTPRGGGKSYVSWGEILGPQFIREFEAEKTGAACADFWYDGKNYWIQENGLWVYYATTEMQRRLKACYGLTDRVTNKNTASQVDMAIIAIQQSRRVQNAAPFLYNPQEIVDHNGQRYLNVNYRKMMEPASVDGDFPWLREFFDKIWDDARDEHGISQRDYFFAWLKRFWESGREGRLLKGQAMFIAGLVNQGKTFISEFIMGKIAGGNSSATDYLMGKTGFNKELGEVGSWSVDDGDAALTEAARQLFSNNIKKFAANPSISYQPKYLDATKLPCTARLIVTCNTDEASLSIIPTTEISILDKLMLLKFSSWMPKFARNNGQEQVVLSELPYFLRWLSKWEPPKEILGDSRYGVRSFCHPDILQHSRALDASTMFLNDLDDLRFAAGYIMEEKERSWEGTSGELVHRLSQFRPSSRYHPVVAGRYLAKIVREGRTPWLSCSGVARNQPQYRITKD